MLQPGSDSLTASRFSPWGFGESGSECAGCWKHTGMRVKSVTPPVTADLSLIGNSSDIFI